MSETAPGVAIHPVPRALLASYARIWTSLRGGEVEERDLGWGRSFVWCGPAGEQEGLPDRMYGLSDVRPGSWDPDQLPAGVAFNLPPGVYVEGALNEVTTYLLPLKNLGDAWESLRRVGRQGVKKAERAGCQIDALSDEAFLRLATLKAEALGAPTPESTLTSQLRTNFGDAFGMTGVFLEGQAVAAVSWVVVEGYALLIDGVSDRRFWSCNPNNLAVWRAIEDVAARGAELVDYGFSPVGSGDGRFKDHMGGRAVPLYRVLT